MTVLPCSLKTCIGGVIPIFSQLNRKIAPTQNEITFIYSKYSECNKLYLNANISLPLTLSCKTEVCTCGLRLYYS